MLLVLKLATLLAFAGGPLYVHDHLRALDPPLAFALAFTPVGVMLFAALTLHEEDSGFSRGVTRAGLAATLLLCAQNAWLVHGVLVAHDTTTPGFHAIGSSGDSVGSESISLAFLKFEYDYKVQGKDGNLTAAGTAKYDAGLRESS